MTIDEAIQKITDQKAKTAIKSIKSLLTVYKSTSVSVELTFHKDNLPEITAFAKKIGLPITKDRSQHDTLVIGKVKIRSTSKKKSTGGTANSLGKALANAGELATIKSLTHNINTPEDTGQKIFIDNPDIFKKWELSFKYTKPAVIKVCGGALSGYDIIHDATDTSQFSRIVGDIVKYGKPLITSKDAWCPADLFMIKKANRSAIESTLSEIINKFKNNSENLLKQINAAILQFWNKKTLIPISLKQLTSKTAKISYNNESATAIPSYDVSIFSFQCNMSTSTKEIGGFVFLNNKNNKQIRMQVRGFPFGYNTTQMEITSDGSDTGGRLGKVPTNIIDTCMDKYNDSRIKSIAYFGKAQGNRYFTEFNEQKIKEVYSWWSEVSRCPKVTVDKNYTLSDFTSMIAEAMTNADMAALMATKIQGLKIMQFFVKNSAHTSEILTDLLNGAQKINQYSAFFVKIY